MIELHFSPRKLFHIIAAWTVLSLAILACGIGASAPDASAPEEPMVIAPTQGSSQEEPAEDIQPPTIIKPTAMPAMPERRRLTLEYPAQIREGDSDVVRLTLEVDDLGNITPTAQIEGNVVTGEVVEIPNLYESHHVIAEAKFDIAGIQVSPSELSSQTLSPGQTISFYWSVRPQDAGVFRGTIWFYLRFVDKVSGEESRRTVSAQIVQIEAVNILGLPAKVVRTAGGVGSVVGAVIGFPFFEDIIRFIFGKRIKHKK
jgi:hypothetical protein